MATGMTSGRGDAVRHGLLLKSALGERAEVHLLEEDRVLGAQAPANAGPVHDMGSGSVSHRAEPAGSAQ
eukprot:3743840-Alexandrium_andersonii.AAC.1